jgi:3-hydroxybutyryl-CoA dehydrogenase
MKIAVAGAGVMGSGIALCSIQAGYETLLFDLNTQAVEKGKAYIENELNKAVSKGKLAADAVGGMLQKLTCTTHVKDLQADLIIEAVVEKLEVKQSLFAELEAINGPETILATNTSSIPITQIARGLSRPERLVGIHFFNPAHLMKLVEIISGAVTDSQVAQQSFDWAVSLGKKAVYAADAPGFIVNRVARHYYVEGLKVLEEQVASMEAIDRLCEASGFKMGPFRLMDLIGVDTNYSVTSSMYELFGYDAKFRPSRIQKQKVDAGHHGRKSGQGFYTYEK